ncbi:hypothetical protein L6303_05900 [archaeon]|nr:hypothetical protein [Nanoarchaeota archaeon]MBU4451235.1 hypothetical protein [Nanoarchaeota archaeon]MCG2724252.1 hypothetical protein [archaeon]
MIGQDLKPKQLYSQKIIGKLQRDLNAFDIMMKKRMQLMKDELDELSLVNNKELMSELKKSEEDFKNGRVVRCNNKEEMEKHFESL